MVAMAIAVENNINPQEVFALLDSLNQPGPKATLREKRKNLIVTCVRIVRLVNHRYSKVAVLFGYSKETLEPIRFYLPRREDVRPIDDALSSVPTSAVHTPPMAVSLTALAIAPMPDATAGSFIAVGYLVQPATVMQTLGLNSLL